MLTATKQQILKEVIGEEFEIVNQNNEDYFQSSKGDALIFDRNDPEFNKNLFELCKKEIPFLHNDFLIKYLPEKFNNISLLNDLKELCKFDHTLLSNFIIKSSNFIINVMDLVGLSNLFLDGSKQIDNDNYYIFYLENE